MNDSLNESFLRYSIEKYHGKKVHCFPAVNYSRSFMRMTYFSHLCSAELKEFGSVYFAETFTAEK